MAAKKKTAKTPTRRHARRRAGVHVKPNEGRPYPMGRVHTVFKADGRETDDRYAISEWWLDPWTAGPGPHHHAEDDVFYVLEGTMSIRLGERWLDCPKGTLVIAPGGTTHDFENRTAKRAGFLNVSVPGGFEEHVPGIAEWFRTRPNADVAARPRRRARS